MKIETQDLARQIQARNAREPDVPNLPTAIDKMQANLRKLAEGILKEHDAGRSLTYSECLCDLCQLAREIKGE